MVEGEQEISFEPEEEIKVDIEADDMADDYIIEQIDDYDDQFLSTNVDKTEQDAMPEEDQGKHNLARRSKHRNSPCRFCGLVLSRRNRRIEHERLHILEETQQFYSCYLCGRSFNQKTGLIPHFKSCHGYVQ